MVEVSKLTCIGLDIAWYAERPTLLAKDSVPAAGPRSLNPASDQREFAPPAISETHRLHDSAVGADQCCQESDRILAESSSVRDRLPG